MQSAGAMQQQYYISAMFSAAGVRDGSQARVEGGSTVTGGGGVGGYPRGVQQSDSRRNEAVPEPAGPGTEDPVAPPRGEEGKQSVAGVRAVLFDAACPPQTSLALDSLNGGE